MRDLTDRIQARDMPLENSSPSTRNVGLLLFDRCNLSNVDVIGRALRYANEIAAARRQAPTYRVLPLSRHGGNIVTSSISIWTQSLEAYCPEDLDSLFVAFNEDESATENATYLFSWLSGADRVAYDEHAPKGCIPVASSSTRRRRPVVFWFKDAPVSAGKAGQTPLEMALAKVEMDLGVEVARRVARESTPSDTGRAELRAGDLNVTTAVDKIRESARWMRENLGKDISVADAAELAAMSNRNYLRRFKAEFGAAPLEYLLRTRFELICRLLIETDLPVDKIARRCGMGNGDRMGRLFRRRYGLSPTAYRVQARTRPEDRDAGHPVTEAYEAVR
jgi:transcriptional regulator GlxA family with amidase domain